GVQRMVDVVRKVHVSDAIKHYALSLVVATRQAPELRLGASPRAGLQLLRAARAQAALEGREYVIPDDVQSLAVPVLAHRVLPTSDAHLSRRGPEAIITEIVHRVPIENRVPEQRL